MSNLLTAALAYAELGWHIFPCAPGGKTPLLKGKGCRDASADPEQIRTWWTAHPNANIGLACGKNSGVSVIDLDVDPDNNENGWETLKEFPDLPATIIADSPRGGAHFIFSAEDPPANKNDFAKGIDIRGDGYYILLAPSIHPNGKEYAWRAGHSPWDISPAPFPDFMRPAKPEVQPTPPPSRPVSYQPSRTPIEERARLYLQECDPAISGAGGHNRLLWAARAMVKGFLLPESTALYLLETEYNSRCCPPWNLADPREAKDFRRKVSEASRTYAQKPEGWLLDEYNLRSYWSDNDALLDAGNQIAANLLRGISTPRPEPVEIPEEKREEIEHWLLQPPGLVGDICNWINATALKEQPLLTLAASLTLCGAVMGRKVKDEWDNRTNLYAMSVAPSSAGKNHARKQVKRLIDAAGINELLGGEDVTSDAAIEKRMESQPVTFFLWDEIGHMMQSIRSSGSNPHLSKVLPTLMKLYSASGETYMGKEYATGDRRSIEQPCCCLYGTTTPDKLVDGISTSEIKDGFLGRIMVFVSTENPKKDFSRAKVTDIPEHLVTAIKDWWMSEVVPGEGTPNITAVTKPFQVTIPTTEEAQRRFLELEELAESRASNTLEKSKGVDALWGKAGENARKIALIVACGDCGQDAVIDEVHADYACKLVSYLISRLADLVIKNVAESQFEKDKQYLLKTIKTAGTKGISKSNLTRRTQKFDARQRENYLRDLVDAEEIVIRYDLSPIMIYPYPYGLKQ